MVTSKRESWRPGRVAVSSSDRSNVETAVEPRGTVPESRSAPSVDKRAALARAALATARLRRQRERALNPVCPRMREHSKRGKRVCGARTIQNEVERERGTYWCPRCARYAFGNGFGQQGPLNVPRIPGR